MINTTFITFAVVKAYVEGEEGFSWKYVHKIGHFGVAYTNNLNDAKQFGYISQTEMLEEHFRANKVIFKIEEYNKF